MPVLYYTIGALSLNYGGNMYVNYMLASIPDIPAAAVAIYATDKIGRKRTTLGGCFVSGILIGAVALVPQTFEYRRVLVLSLTVVAKLFCSVAFSGIYLWTSEIFPTVLRVQGMAACGMFEKISIVALLLP